MIEIKSFGSSSDGNGYLIDDGHSQLLIECGVSVKKVLPQMKHDLSKVAGLLVTHEHRDHCKYISSILSETSIDIFATAGTIEAIKKDKSLRVSEDDDYRFNRLKYMKQRYVGDWKVTAFETKHDVAEPCGFFIESAEGETVLFITDSYYSKYRFPAVNYLMVEMNYSLDIIQEKLSDNKKLMTRIMGSHFDYKHALKFIKENKSEHLKEVWLLHLSDSNSDEALFKKETQQLTGAPVFIA